MSKIIVKAEHLPERCEICHKSDCFQPKRNYCTRCAKARILIPSIGIENPDHWNSATTDVLFRKFFEIVATAFFAATFTLMLIFPSSTEINEKLIYPEEVLSIIVESNLFGAFIIIWASITAIAAYPILYRGLFSRSTVYREGFLVIVVVAASLIGLALGLLISEELFIPALKIIVCACGC